MMVVGIEYTRYPVLFLFTLHLELQLEFLATYLQLGSLILFE